MLMVRPVFAVVHWAANGQPAQAVPKAAVPPPVLAARMGTVTRASLWLLSVSSLVVRAVLTAGGVLMTGFGARLVGRATAVASHILATSRLPTQQHGDHNSGDTPTRVIHVELKDSAGAAPSAGAPGPN
jgi:hypothetical protein